jgi:pimeloyl-ACP methyl ester carboxylesterase
VARRQQEHGERRNTAGRPLSACPDLPADGEAPPLPADPAGPPADRREAPAPQRGGLRALTTRLGRDVRALATPGGVRGAVVESLWVTAHVATYPWGLLRERPSGVERYGYGDLRPLQRGLLVRDVEAAGTPILLLHGMIDNRAIFTLLTRRLRAHGFTRVRTLNYPPTTNDIRAAAENLAAEVEALVAESGHERIHVVGHSLGGLIARYYVQRLGGDARVRTLVTLGTPHHGTLAAHLVPARLGRQLRPGSDLFRELDLPAPEFATRVVAYWSDLDQLIVPHDNARLEHADLRGHNVVVHGVGHLSLPINGRVVHEVAQVLSATEAETAPDGVAQAADQEPEENTPA